MPDPSREPASNIKERLVAEAEQLAGSVEWKGASRRYQELKSALQSAPSLGRARDRDIERRFNAARQRFHDNRIRASVTAKSRLVERAKRLADQQDLKAAKADYKVLQLEWRSIGRAGAEEDALRARFDSAGDAIWEADRLRWRRRQEEQIERLRVRVLREETAYDSRLASGTDFDRRVAAMKPGARKSAGEDRVWGINEDLRRRGHRIAELKRELEEAKRRLQERK